MLFSRSERSCRNFANDLRSNAKLRSKDIDQGEVGQAIARFALSAIQPAHDARSNLPNGFSRFVCTPATLHQDKQSNAPPYYTNQW